MLSQDFRGQRNRLLRPDHPIGPNLQGELIVINALAHTGGFHIIIHFINRSVDRINRKLADHTRRHVLLIPFCGDIPAAFVQGQFHIQLRAFAQRCNVHLRVQDLNLAVALDRVGRHLTRALRTDFHCFGAVAMEFRGQTFDVQNNLGDILLDARDGRKLVQHAVDLNRRDRNARQGGKQYPAQAVAQRGTKAAFQRFHYKFTVGSVIAQDFCFNFWLLNLDH